MKRIICRLRGHRWGPWFQMRWWHPGDVIDEYWRRACWRCTHYEEQEGKP